MLNKRGGVGARRMNQSYWVTFLRSEHLIHGEIFVSDCHRTWHKQEGRAERAGDCRAPNRRCTKEEEKESQMRRNEIHILPAFKKYVFDFIMFNKHNQHMYIYIYIYIYIYVNYTRLYGYSLLHLWVKKITMRKNGQIVQQQRKNNKQTKSSGYQIQWGNNTIIYGTDIRK